MAQLPQRFRFDLPDSLPGHREILPHLFKRMIGVFADAESLAKDPLLPRRESLQRIIDLPLKIVPDRGLQRRDGLFVLDTVAEMAVFLFTDGRLQRDRLLGDFQDLADLVQRELHLLGDLFREGFPAKLLYEMARRANELVDRLNHVHRNPDGPGLVGNGAGDRLANPPGRTGAELNAAIILYLMR